MIIPSRFQPAWWLRGGHAQTIWPTLLRPRVRLPVRRERVLLADGDFIDVDWAGEMGPIVVVLHGLAGSIASQYARGVLRAFARRGEDIAATAGPRESDERATAPLHGFRDADDYYAHASCRPF